MVISICWPTGRTRRIARANARSDGSVAACRTVSRTTHARAMRLQRLRLGRRRDPLPSRERVARVSAPGEGAGAMPDFRPRSGTRPRHSRARHCSRTAARGSPGALAMRCGARRPRCRHADPVDLDDEAMREADEIDNERSERLLTAELDLASWRLRKMRHISRSASVALRRKERARVVDVAPPHPPMAFGHGDVN